MPHAWAKFLQLLLCCTAHVHLQSICAFFPASSYTRRFAEIYLHPPETICLMQLRLFSQAGNKVRHGKPWFPCGRPMGLILRIGERRLLKKGAKDWNMELLHCKFVYFSVPVEMTPTSLTSRGKIQILGATDADTIYECDSDRIKCIYMQHLHCTNKQTIKINLRA